MNVSASEGLSALPAVSIGTSPTQNASPAVESNPGLSATACVSSPGTGAPTSVSNIYESNSSPASIYNAALNVAGSLSITSQGLGGSNRTRSRTSTTPLPTASVTCALVVTNSQGSVPNVVEVGCSSNAPSTNTSFAYVGSVMTTVTALLAGISIQTATTSICTITGAVITTTSSGSTVATEVPETCIHGLVFLVFGLPGFHSSSDIPPLCHKSFPFPLGITWRLLCPPGGIPTISITSVDSTKLPPGAVGRQARTRMVAILTTKSLPKPKDRASQTAQNPHPPIWPIRTTPSEKERQAVNAQHRICCSQTWNTERSFQMPPHHARSFVRSFVLSLDGRRSFLE